MAGHRTTMMHCCPKASGAEAESAAAAAAGKAAAAEVVGGHAAPGTDAGAAPPDAAGTGLPPAFGPMAHTCTMDAGCVAIAAAAPMKPHAHVLGPAPAGAPAANAHGSRIEAFRQPVSGTASGAGSQLQTAMDVCRPAIKAEPWRPRQASMQCVRQRPHARLSPCRVCAATAPQHAGRKVHAPSLADVIDQLTKV